MKGIISSPSARPNAVPKMPPVRKIRTPRQNLRMSFALAHDLARKPVFTFRDHALVRRGKPAHREFDAVARQFAPAFDRGHIGGLRIAREYLARFGARGL